MFSYQAKVKQQGYCPNCGLLNGQKHHCERCGFLFIPRFPFRKAPFTPRNIKLFCDTRDFWKFRLNRCLIEIDDVPITLYTYLADTMLCLLSYLNSRRDIDIVSIDFGYSQRKDCTKFEIVVKKGT